MNVDVNLYGKIGLPPTFIAVRYNSITALEILINANCSLGALDLDGRTLLHEAVKFGFITACKVSN